MSTLFIVLAEVRHPAECKAEENAPQKPGKYYVCPSEAAAASGDGGGVGQCHVTSSMLCDLKRDCAQAEDENDHVCGEYGGVDGKRSPLRMLHLAPMFYHIFDTNPLSDFSYLVTF